MLDRRQNKLFRPIVSAAWQAHAARTGADPSDRLAQDRWYRKTLWTELGFYTTKQVSPTDQPTFDSLCLTFARIAGDSTQIGYWATAAERRALWRLHRSMETAGVGPEYVRAIAVNMGFLQDNNSRSVEDLPAELILKLNTALFLSAKRRRRPVDQEVPF